MADAKTYQVAQAIEDYRIEIGDHRPSASSITARLNHVLDYLDATGKLEMTCAEAGTEEFVTGFRAWSATQPVVWVNGKGEITKQKDRTIAATEESVHQLRAVLNHAVFKERSDAKPRFKGKSRQVVSRPVRTRCDEIVLGDMLAYAAEPGERRGPLHAFIMASLCTMARPDAIVDISTLPNRRQWRPGDSLLDLNPEGRMQTKKHRPMLPVLPALKPWLVHTHENPEITGRWLVHYNKGPVKNVRSAWRTMIAALGLPEGDREWGAYVIRRSLATLMRGAKVDQWDLQGFMGHRIAGTTEIYAQELLFSTVTEKLSVILDNMATRHGSGILLPTPHAHPTK